MNRYLGIYRRCELYYIREELEKYGLLSLEGRLLCCFGMRRIMRGLCLWRTVWQEARQLRTVGRH